MNLCSVIWKEDESDEKTKSSGGGEARWRLEPMTPAECDLATENHYLVEQFLKSRRLPFDEWYDIVIFRYIRAVELWFRKPELYQYQFSTIAWRNMDSAVFNERKKQRIRIQAGSLDEEIPGMDGLTYNSIITADNLNYIPYTEVN